MPPRILFSLKHALSRPRAWVTVTGVAAALALAGTGVAVAVAVPGATTGASPDGGSAGGQGGSHPVSHAASAGPAGSGAPHPAGPASGRPGIRPLATSCHAVAHIGDSTSEGMISPAYLPDPAQRLVARYAAVGVRTARVAASGGRSIVEAMPGQVNGYDTALRLRGGGFRGCWVFALGTNDTANVSAGSAVGRMTRIQRMMSAAHGEPVLWVNVRTLDRAGPWSEANMRAWDAALRQACARYPNLRIFDWAAMARGGWFIADGIHYTSAGYAARARLIAGALATAFPAAGASHGCVVR